MRSELEHGVKRARRLLTAPRLHERHIAEALSRLPEQAPGVLLVHSSLSSCGHVEGGTAAVISALRTWNRGGTLTMPTHSYCYPAASGIAPVFDPASTRSVVGAVTDAFWRDLGVKRSLHPTHSLAAEGPMADDVVRGHEQCDTPCGSGTPYERLVQHDAAVLMFGASLDSYTLFHTAEADAQVPYLYEPERVQLRFLDDGVEKSMLMRKQNMQVRRSFGQKDTWLEGRGLLHRVPLGAGELMLVPHAQHAHAALVAELRRDPGFLRAA